jgi:hypothetical protein
VFPAAGVQVIDSAPEVVQKREAWLAKGFASVPS